MCETTSKIYLNEVSFTRPKLVSPLVQKKIKLNKNKFREFILITHISGISLSYTKFNGIKTSFHIHITEI